MTRAILFFILLLCVPSRLPAAPPEEALSFADALFEEEDYYRAITEYKRFLHLHPDTPRSPEASLRIAECFLKGKRWTDAEKALEKTITSFPESAESTRASLLHAGIPFARGDFEEARVRYGRIEEAALTDGARQEARYRIAWSFLEENNFADARTRFLQIDTEDAKALAAESDRLEETSLKSPEIAGVLSAVLPGAGQLYAGRTKEATLAFLLNAAFIGAAVEAFDNDNEVLGGILLFFEAGWYGGNIFNAANSAHKENRDRLEKGKGALRSRFGLRAALNAKGVSLGISGRF